MAVTINGTTGITTPDITTDSATIDTTTLVVDEVNNRVGIGTASPNKELDLGWNSSSFGWAFGPIPDVYNAGIDYTTSDRVLNIHSTAPESTTALTFSVGNSGPERMRIDSSGNLLLAKTTTSGGVAGTVLYGGANKGIAVLTTDGARPLYINRLTNDGTLVDFSQDSTTEGNISVSGTTVSYNGGHLARWSRLADDSKDTSIVKGTVMTNLDAMVEWSHDAVEAQDAVYDEEGNVITEAIEAKDAYTEDNEQLNKMAVSSVEGDPNVAGVFVNWDEDDDGFNDMNIAMTGDMVIRIAQGTTVERGDLLMSAGDGTAKPQGDDIVRSKTIAKVTSTHVSHTYNDGSYLVPCVLMAC